MSDGGQGPTWWFAWVGNMNTNIGMARFLAVPLTFIMCGGIAAWAIFP